MLSNMQFRKITGITISIHSQTKQKLRMLTKWNWESLTRYILHYCSHVPPCSFIHLVHMLLTSKATELSTFFKMKENYSYYKRPWKALPLPIKLIKTKRSLKLRRSTARCMFFHWRHQENTFFYFDCYYS